MNNTTTTANTSIPITKMVNDLFLQWLSLADTRTTLYAALQSVRTNSKMPDPIIYPKTYTTRGGGFSKPQHFDSPPVSPVPRTASSPRSGLSSIPSTGENISGLTGSNDERKQRSLKKKYPIVNGGTTPSITTISSIDQQQKRRRAIHFCEQCRYYGRYCDAIHKGFCRPVSTPLARISISPKIPKSHINFVFEKRYPADQIQQHIQQQIRQKFTNPEAIWPLKPQAIVGQSTIPDQQHRSALFISEVSGGKVSPSQLAKSEPLPTSPSTSTSVIQNRIPSTTTTTATTGIPSNGTISKPTQQTPILQPSSQSPSTIIHDLSPTPTSPKPIVSGVASLREHFDSVEHSPSITKAKTPIQAKSPVSPVPTDNIQRQTSIPSKTTPQPPPSTTTTTVKEISPIPTTVIKPEETSKSVDTIPKFYFPNGQITMTSTTDTLLNKQLRHVKEELFLPKHDKLHLEDFGKLAQLIDLSLYWKTPLFRACVQDSLGSKTTITSNTTVTYSQFESLWKKLCKNHHDNASKFIHLLVLSSPSSLPINRQYLTVDDWDYLIQDIIDTHPGLKFLREAREFHSRYIKTVVARVYYNCNRSWSGKLTVQELRRSNFLSTLDRIEEEEDINRIHDYFSYEHFYVIYCKFWELDSDHDLLISRDDLAKHNNGAISNKMIDRIFSGAISNSQNMREGKMSYYEFVWFLISEEDKRSPTSIEYWFRCMDLDGDGVLSMFELDYFYQEQVHKMEIYGIEYMPFEDCICQMLDLVKPEEENKIRLKDLKRCKLTNVFFDTFFNLEKYLDNEQKDPFSNVKDPDSPDVSDWVKFAEAEYDNLTHEDGANENLDDVNYDEDFEDEDDGVAGPVIEQSTNKRIGLGGNTNAVSPPQRLGSTGKMNDIDERWKD
ncbi:unnamed protein product [Rotaria sordida]|uniref:EF-hand domain-containing protein n=1 Tax=Rotaria sordida TaxID=392033 RepID=A0A815LDH3_9BILA|nr:unnamed protein product [Rotaria sordida]